MAYRKIEKTDEQTELEMVEARALMKLLDLTGLKLDDMPKQMTKDDYATVFARVIKPEIYALVLQACVTKAIKGNMRAIEIIVNQAQGSPSPRADLLSVQDDALMRLQQAVMLAGVKVQYAIEDGSNDDA